MKNEDTGTIYFSPVMSYTMTRTTLRRLLLNTPYPALWNGRSYVIVSQHIGAGVYSVTGEFLDEREPPRPSTRAKGKGKRK